LFFLEGGDELQQISKLLTKVLKNDPCVKFKMEILLRILNQSSRFETSLNIKIIFFDFSFQWRIKPDVPTAPIRMKGPFARCQIRREIGRRRRETEGEREGRGERERDREKKERKNGFGRDPFLLMVVSPFGLFTPQRSPPPHISQISPWKKERERERERETERERERNEGGSEEYNFQGSFLEQKYFWSLSFCNEVEI